MRSNWLDVELHSDHVIEAIKVRPQTSTLFCSLYIQNLAVSHIGRLLFSLCMRCRPYKWLICINALVESHRRHARTGVFAFVSGFGVKLCVHPSLITIVLCSVFLQ